jgi:hypothetical protein
MVIAIFNTVSASNLNRKAGRRYYLSLLDKKSGKPVCLRLENQGKFNFVCHLSVERKAHHLLFFLIKKVTKKSRQIRFLRRICRANSQFPELLVTIWL